MPMHLVEKDRSVSSWHRSQRHDHEGARHSHEAGTSSRLTAAEGALVDMSEIRMMPVARPRIMRHEL